MERKELNSNVFDNLSGGTSPSSIDISNGVGSGTTLGNHTGSTTGILGGVESGTGSTTGILGGGRSNGIWVAPNTTTIHPSITTPITTTIPMTSGTMYRYWVFELPQKSVPESVYVSGRLVTLGILGSDVECAFAGDKLIFAPGILTAALYTDRVTVSLKYYNKTYHYNIGNTSAITYKEGSNTMDPDLISTISHKRK